MRGPGSAAEVPDVPLLQLESSYRVAPAEATFERARPLMSALGISRVTDITRMDRLGLPVYASIRPRSLTLRVHSGKGMRRSEAKVGALMEAIEHMAAEPRNSAWRLRRRSVADVAAQFQGSFDFVDFIPRLGLSIGLNQKLATVSCQDVGGTGAFDLPAELVFLPFEDPETPRLFGASANGLASGNSCDEATLHGVLEVLERDATSMNTARDRSTWIPPASLPEPFRTQARRWRDAGVNLAVRLLPNGFQMPCFAAYLHESASTDVNLAHGSGLHVDKRIALARAICEAAQSRLGHIHGGRDDVTVFYAKYDDPSNGRQDAEFRAVAEMFEKRPSTHYSQVPSESLDGMTMSQALSSVLKRVASAGFPRVFRYSFQLDLNGLHVVRVVIPKCENNGANRRRVGPRLLGDVLGDD